MAEMPVMSQAMAESAEVLYQWLKALRGEHYDEVIYYTQATWLANHDGRELSEFGDMDIQDFETLSTEEVSPVMHRHEVEIEHKAGKSKITLMTICETGPYKPSDSGVWGVNPSSWRLNG